MNSLSSFDVTVVVVVVVVMLSYHIPGGSSLLYVYKVHGVVVRVFCLYGKLFFSNYHNNIMENNGCHNNVTGPFRGYPEVMEALKMGFQQA